MIDFRKLLLKNLDITHYSFVDNYLIYLDSVKSKNVSVWEKHHILPKSVFPEFKTDRNNIILLSPSDHYIAHKYLFLIGRNKELWFSFNMMKNTRKQNNLLSDEDYDNFKFKYSKFLSDYFKSNHNFTSEKSKIASNIKWNDISQRDIQRNFMIKNNPMNILENRKKVSLSKLGKPRKDMLGEGNPMKREEISLKFKGKNNPNYIGTIIHSSSGIEMNSKMEFINYILEKYPSKSKYFCEKLYNFILNRDVIIKQKEEILFESIKKWV